MMDFANFVNAATGGDEPYSYQSRLAEDGLPDVLRAPTGSGKSLAATLPWLYRRRFHRDPTVRAATPRWLVVVLPQRSLVEQTVSGVRTWLANAAVEVPVQVLMGGEHDDDRAWRMDPAQERIFVGTQDMVLSRRDGRAEDARLLWVIPPPGRASHLPYEDDELSHTARTLTQCHVA